MFTVKKLFALKDHMLFLLIVLYFCICFFAVKSFDVYTVTPSEQKSIQVTSEGTTAVEAEETSEISAPLITDTRTLKEYRGVIGIFDCFGNLLGSFDIDVALLPTEDRKSLDDGIVFASENEMRDFLETLDS